MTNQPDTTWEDKFWEEVSEYNLSLDNENFDDLISFVKSREALARREGIEEAMRVVEGFKVKGLGNLSNRGVEGFQKEVGTQQNEMLWDIVEALQEKLDTKGV